MMFATTKDVVFIEGLTINTVIGVYNWERKIEQPVQMDIALFNDTHIVAESHNLANGVNYKSVCDDVTEWTKAMQPKLVEELAEHLANELLANYPVSKVTIKIGKPIAIASANLVGVQITREAE